MLSVVKIGLKIGNYILTKRNNVSKIDVLFGLVVSSVRGCKKVFAILHSNHLSCFFGIPSSL